MNWYTCLVLNRYRPNDFSFVYHLVRKTWTTVHVWYWIVTGQMISLLCTTWWEKRELLYMFGIESLPAKWFFFCVSLVRKAWTTIHVRYWIFYTCLVLNHFRPNDYYIVYRPVRQAWMFMFDFDIAIDQPNDYCIVYELVRK